MQQLFLAWRFGVFLKGFLLPLEKDSARVKNGDHLILVFGKKFGCIMFTNDDNLHIPNDQYQWDVFQTSTLKSCTKVEEYSTFEHDHLTSPFL